MRDVLTSAEFWDIANAMASGHVMERVDPLNRRSDDARATLDDYGPDNPPPGIWLGVSVEDQIRADERIPHLLATPAAVRFLSCEPLLGPVDLTNITGAEKSRDYGSPVHGWSAIWKNNHIGRAWIDWVIVGCESGPRARLMPDYWAESIVVQCQQAGTAVFVKQLSSGSAKAIKDIDQFPERLRVRGMPG